jgi:hypothetical protein
VTDSSESKICRACAETIKAKAKVCPHCQTSQNLFAKWLSLILWALVLFVLLAALVVAWDELPSYSFGLGGRSFARHRADLLVTQTRLERIGEQSDFLLLGYVTNRGETAWRVRGFEVRLVDSGGTLQDALHPAPEDNFVVQPKQQHAFQVKLRNLAYTSNGVVENVRVESATDGNYYKTDD